MHMPNLLTCLCKLVRPLSPPYCHKVLAQRRNANRVCQMTVYSAKRACESIPHARCTATSFLHVVGLSPLFSHWPRCGACNLALCRGHPFCLLCSSVQALQCCNALPTGGAKMKRILHRKLYSTGGFAVKPASVTSSISDFNGSMQTLHSMVQSSCYTT